MLPLFLLLIILTTPTFAEENIILDLKDPKLSDGVLSTDCGGVIEGPNIRIQARELSYTKKVVDGAPVSTLYAKGDLILQFGEYYFVAESIEYDFEQHEGVMTHARTSLEPWFFGGERVLLHADGSFTLYSGFITTTETHDFDWSIQSDVAHLKEKRFLDAKPVTFRIYNIPVLWLPCLKTNLDTIFDAPVRYNFRWGGSQGSRATMVYEVFNWNRLKTFLRVDYRIKRGFGGGIETYYKSEDGKEIFNTINYVADDNSITNEDENIRYRFQGLYHNVFYDDKVTLDLTWDKLSDRDMATDYNDRGLELDTAGRTELLIRRQEDTRIERLTTHLKINQFESIKQELPTLEVSWIPKTLGETGVISNSLMKASYLDFSYGNDILHPHDFNSTRVEWTQGFYRPIPLKILTLTPKAGFVGIYYGNSPQSKERALGLLNAGFDAKSSFSRYYENVRHVMEPYGTFQYLTSPTVSPNRHYIFDIDDGWFQSNTLRLGVRNEIYQKLDEGSLSRPFFLDLYTYGFFDTPTIGQTFPKGYLTLSVLSTPTLRNTIDTAWDFQHQILDHLNVRSEWTVSKNLALSAEYRVRSKYAFRKADTTNFILDSYRSERELVHSQLSDQRQTILNTLFYQFDPNWAFFFEARHGWDRRDEPYYTEFETALLGTLPSAWNVKFSYRHQQGDDRVAVYFSIGLHKPNQRRCESMLPCLEL